MTVVRETVQVNGPERMKHAWTEPGAHGAEYETLGVSDDTVYLSRALLRRGVNKHSGKTWANMTNTSLSVYSWRHGRLRYYTKTKLLTGNKRTTFQDMTANAIARALSKYGTPTLLEQKVLEARGFESMRDLMLSEYPLAEEIPAGTGVTPHLVHANVQDFTRSYFGNPRYRKDLVRGVGQRGWITAGGVGRLNMLKAFAPLVPTDWIAGHLLELPAPTIYTYRHATDLDLPGGFAPVRRMLRTATAKQVRHLFRDLGADFQMQYRPGASTRDALNSFKLIIASDPSYRLEDIRFDDWRSLHDILAVDQRRIEEPNVEIKYTGKAKQLPGVYGDYTILAPGDTHTLIRWGAEMSNCIGGYGSYVGQGDCLLYAVLKGGEMIANMELTKSGRVRQLVGKFNASLPDEHRQPILAAVLETWPPAIDDLVPVDRAAMPYPQVAPVGGGPYAHLDLRRYQARVLGDFHDNPFR